MSFIILAQSSKAAASSFGIRTQVHDGQGQDQHHFTQEEIEDGEEMDLIKSSFSTEHIAPIDSEELIHQAEQICDDIDETDNILMRTNERAVALSLAELADEPIDPIDQSDLLSTSEGISSCASVDDEGSDVSCASLRSEPEVRTQIELEIPRNIDQSDNSEPEAHDESNEGDSNPLAKSHESSGTVKDF